MRNAGEDIEATGVPGDGLTHQLAGHAGQGDAMAGESLQVVHIRIEPPEVRRAVAGDVHMRRPRRIPLSRPAAAGTPASCARAWPRRCDRIKSGVADAAAEEQAVIGRATEVIQHPVHVGDGRIVGDECLGARCARAARSPRCRCRRP